MSTLFFVLEETKHFLISFCINLINLKWAFASSPAPIKPMVFASFRARYFTASAPTPAVLRLVNSVAFKTHFTPPVFVSDKTIIPSTFGRPFFLFSGKTDTHFIPQVFSLFSVAGIQLILF